MDTFGPSSGIPTTLRQARKRNAAARRAEFRRARSSVTRHRHSLRRRALSIAAMAFSMLLAIGVSIPASAFGGATKTVAVSVAQEHGPIQDASVSSASVAALSARDGYTVILPKPIYTAQDSGAGEPSVTGICAVPAPGPVRWATDTSPQIGRGVSASHHGQDLLIASGTPVHAVTDGVVLVSGTDSTLGQYVVIQGVVAGHAVTSLYGHMQIGSQTVAAGQTVAMGDVIGLVGSSGSATTHLLYLRILQDGQLCDTITFIAGNPAGGAAPH
ncbi:MAG: M23 family metallopeptidase [Pseudolysinimonas sp.]